VPEPAASPAARELYGALEPTFTAGDSERDFVALKICMAICAGRIDLLHELLIDDITNLPAWAKVMDPQSCPEACLPYLAQFSGAILTPEMDEAARRAAIEVPEAFSRGRLASLEAVVKRRLTGTKFVQIDERVGGNAWRVRVTTIEAETPDPEGTEADIKRFQLPVGIVLFMNKVIPWNWKELVEQKATWAVVKEEFSTWAELRSHEV
jgi:hypothetical protein